MEYPIQVYAELLPNIRRVSLAISFAQPAEHTSTVAIQADGRGLFVQNGNDSLEASLPGRVALDGKTLLVKEGLRTTSWRLPLAEDPPEEGESVPWTAADWTPGEGVRCRRCVERRHGKAGAEGEGVMGERMIVKPGAVQEWKDLPSENWAEMMEFWHCHKPDAKDHGHLNGSSGIHNHAVAHDGSNGKMSEEQLAASKGYGASSVIKSQKGVGFVDLATLWFSSEDCDQVVYSISDFTSGSTKISDVVDIAPSGDNHSLEQTETLNVYCITCETRLGYYNFRTEATTVFKWKVLRSQPPNSLSPPPTAAQCLSASLLAATSRTGSSKFLLMPISDKTDEILHLWTMGGTIRYVSTLNYRRPIPAIRLFYRKVRADEANNMLESFVGNVQDISFPEADIELVLNELEETNGFLPSTERAFREWKVGLLPRWEARVSSEASCSDQPRTS